VDFQHFKVIVIIWLICAAVADVIITGVLVWFLVRIPLSSSPQQQI